MGKDGSCEVAGLLTLSPACGSLASAALWIWPPPPLHSLGAGLPASPSAAWRELPTGSHVCVFDSPL